MEQCIQLCCSAVAPLLQLCSTSAVVYIDRYKAWSSVYSMRTQVVGGARRHLRARDLYAAHI